MLTASGNSPAASSWADSVLPDRIDGLLAAMPCQKASALASPHSTLVAVKSSTEPCSTAMRPFQLGLVRSSQVFGYSSGLTRFVFSEGAKALTRSVTHILLGSFRLSGYFAASAGTYSWRYLLATKRTKTSSLHSTTSQFILPAFASWF